MSPILTEEFVGTANTPVTTQNTQATSVNGVVVFTDVGQIHDGSSAAIFSQQSVAEMVWNLSTPVQRCFFRGYFRGSTPAASSAFGYAMVLGRSRATQENLWRVYAKAEKFLYLERWNGGGWALVGQTGGYYLDGTTTFRVEVDADTVQDTLTMRVFSGGNLEVDSPDEVVSGGYPLTEPTDQIRVGMQTPQPVTPVTLLVDSLEVNTAKTPGPWGGTAHYLMTHIHREDTSSPAGSIYTVDTTMSLAQSSVTFRQTSGPPVVDLVEDRPGFFSFSDPGGVEPLVFGVSATKNGLTHTRLLTIRRNYRPSLLSLRPSSGAGAVDPSDTSNWG